MAFTVNFYSINKEDNSTARPTSTPVSYQCLIKHGSGILNPTIELNMGVTTAPAFNYCYIPHFERYYYINEWYYNKAIWTATLSCDVLATYRTEIGNANLYALRTSVSSLYDGRIPDNLYPTKSGCTFSSNAITSLWTVTGGVYVTGVVSKHADFGSIKYYIFSPSDFGTITSYLLSDDLLDDYNFSDADASWELQKALIDPMQYIKSCVYIPVDSSIINQEFQNQETVSIFNWDIWKTSSTVLSRIVLPSKPKLTFTRTVNIPKHPQTSSRGNYVNQRPYTILQLLIPPFGVVELDTTVTCNATSLTCTIDIDMLTGLGILTITCNGMVLNRLEAQIGVPVQLSQITRDYVGGAVATVNAGAGLVANALSGNIAGAISSVASGVGSAIQSLTPRSQTIGSGGAYAPLTTAPKLEAQFFEIVADDINKNGRPCCQVVQCKNNTGYYLIQDGDVMIRGTRDECEQIRSYLESGFYWE